MDAVELAGKKKEDIVLENNVTPAALNRSASLSSSTSLSPNNSSWITTRWELWSFYLYYVVRMQTTQVPLAFQQTLLCRAIMAYPDSTLAPRNFKICST
jgi:hypothetical protein